MGLSLRFDDLNSVSELYSRDDFRQLVMAIETTPAMRPKSLCPGPGRLSSRQPAALGRQGSRKAGRPPTHRCPLAKSLPGDPNCDPVWQNSARSEANLVV